LNHPVTGVAYCLICRPLWPPAMGARGRRGYGTAITEVLELVVLLALVVREGRRCAQAHAESPRGRGPGVPTGLFFGLEKPRSPPQPSPGAFGAVQMAAHQITMNTHPRLLPGVAVGRGRERACGAIYLLGGGAPRCEADRTTRARPCRSARRLWATIRGSGLWPLRSADRGRLLGRPEVTFIKSRLFLKVAAVFQTLTRRTDLRGRLCARRAATWPGR
jgi:hypothetical protein